MYTIPSVNIFTGLNSYEMPLAGFGTYKIQGTDTIYEVIEECLKAGYRSIDTAAVYRNEQDIGYALYKLLPKYGLHRNEIFLTSKLSPVANGKPELIEHAVQKSLVNLGIHYIDLYLIHWPGAAHIHESSKENPSLRLSTMKELVKYQKYGFIRSIGVSNFTIKHIEELLQEDNGLKPAVNQVECHPHYCQKELIKYCRDKGIHVQAYSSLGTSNSTDLLRDPIVVQTASELNVSPARLLLRWAIQQEIGVIPKAIKKEHIRENIKLDFVIPEDKMKSLSILPQKKYAWNPDNVY